MHFSEFRASGFETRAKDGSYGRGDGQTDWFQMLGGLVRCDRLHVAGKKVGLMLATGFRYQISFDENIFYVVRVTFVRNTAEQTPLTGSRNQLRFKMI